MPLGKDDTSWERVSGWYDSITAQEGHFYHKELILPNVIRLLDLSKNASLLDVGCGQGILARSLPSHVKYAGVDLSQSLINQAKQLTKRKGVHFSLGDITK